MAQIDTARAFFEEVESYFEAPAAVFERLIAAYAESHRRYHTLAHIVEMLECLAQCEHLATDKAALSLAIWFHDIVYDVKATSGRNEDESAVLLEQRANGPSVACAATLIRHSAHHGPSENTDTQLFCDLDLYRLGAPYDAFVRHGDDIRLEYGYLADADWRKGRGHFLRQVLDRPVIFQAGFWKARCEEQARANIESALSKLTP